jgi:hypothetical protein
MARTRNYSDFLDSVTQLIGIPPSRLTTEVADSINQFFNNAIRDIWIATQWYDTCPRGEARFVGNKLTYPNDLAKTAYWTATALTVTSNQLANPLDGSVTASKALETSATSEHKVVQNVTSFFPSQEYTITAYVRPNGRNNVQLVAYDGDTTYSAFYDISAGTVGTVVNATGTSISLQPNGFYLCQLNFTASASATSSGTYSLKLSTDGSTVSYAGDTAKGVYVWGCVVQQTTNVPVSDLLLPWQQVGEETIDAVFDVYQASPSSAFYPRQQGYLLTQDGIQMINGAWATYVDGVNQSSIYGILPCNPVFLFYRKYAPTYTGDDYSASSTYAVDDQVYFTDSAGRGNYWKCVAATSAGESPSTTPSKWQVIPLYTVFLQYCIYRAYADWLISDGQLDKGDRASAMADRKLADSIEVQERQMGDVLPTKFQTHVTSRAY